MSPFKLLLLCKPRVKIYLGCYGMFWLMKAIFATKLIIAVILKKMSPEYNGQYHSHFWIFDGKLNHTNVLKMPILFNYTWLTKATQGQLLSLCLISHRICLSTHFSCPYDFLLLYFFFWIKCVMELYQSQKTRKFS